MRHAFEYTVIHNTGKEKDELALVQASTQEEMKKRNRQYSSNNNLYSGTYNQGDPTMKKSHLNVVNIILSIAAVICLMAFPHLNAKAWDEQTLTPQLVSENHYSVTCTIPYSEACVSNRISYMQIFCFALDQTRGALYNSQDPSNYLSKLDGSHCILASQNLSSNWTETEYVHFALDVHTDYGYHIPVGTYSVDYVYANHNEIHIQVTLIVTDDRSNGNHDDSSSQAAVQSGSSGSSGCDHDFQWVCVKEPTAGEDGYDEYRCTKCGLVSQTRTTSGFSTFSDKTLDVVTSTPEGQPVSITTDSFWSFNHDFTDMIAARKSGDITVDFWYKNSHYKMTIPAGTDFTPYLTGTGKGYIGFMKIYSIVGGTCIGHR